MLGLCFVGVRKVPKPTQADRIAGLGILVFNAIAKYNVCTVNQAWVVVNSFQESLARPDLNWLVATHAEEQERYATLLEAASELSLWAAAALDALRETNPTGMDIDYGYRVKALVDRLYDAALMEEG